MDCVDKEAKDNIDANLDSFGRWVKYGFTLLQQARTNPHIPELQNYVENIRQAWTSKMKVSAKANDNLKLWQKLGGPRAQKLADYIFHVMDLSFAQGRRLNKNELLTEAQKKGLDQDTFSLYVDIDRHMVETLSRIENLMVLNVEGNSKLHPNTIKTLTDKIKSDFALQRNRNYFPAASFGDHLIEIRAKGDLKYQGRDFKKGETVALEFFESERDMKGGLENVEKHFPGAKFIHRTQRLSKEVSAFRGFPPSLIENFDHGTISEQELKTFNTVVAKMLPSRGLLKNLNKKRGIAGAARDVQRAYASYFQEASNHVMKLEWKPALVQGVAALEARAEAALGPNAHVAGDIAQAMKNHLNYFLHPGNELSNIRGMVFLYYFAYVPKQAFVNTLQLPMGTWPQLASMSNPATATVELARAMKDITQSFNFRETLKIQNPMGLPASAQFDQNAPGMDDQDRKVLQLGYEAGFVDESAMSEMAAMAGNRPLERLLPYFDKADKLARDMLELGVLPFKLTEEYNRRVTLLAAARIVRKQGGDIDEQFRRGREAVDLTQGEYARWNRPVFMRNKAAIFTIFRTFQQNNLYFFLMGPAKRYAWTVALLMGGLKALPGSDDLMKIIDMLGGLLFGPGGKPEAEKHIRQLADYIGLHPDLVMNGIARSSFGMHGLGSMMGLPVPEIDVSTSIEQGRVVPGVEAVSRFAAGQSSGTQFGGEFAEQIFGPLGSVAMGLFRAAQKGSGTDRVLAASPKAIRNAVNTFRYLHNEQITTSRGEKLLDVDTTDPEQVAEVLAYGGGFTPARISRKYENYFAKKEAENYYKGLRSQLYSNYSIALASKSRESIADAKQAIADFNKKAPKGFGISQDNLKKSVISRTRNRNLREQGKPSQKEFLNLYRELDRLYPLE
jgi:hypothetical protein